MKRAVIVGTLLAALCGRVLAAPTPLRICADPDNLPFSNERGEGFENRLARLIAHDLHRPLETVWWSQRRGYARHTLGEARCDAWLGVARGVEGLATTAPYYRATYVFVTRADRDLSDLSLDDERLRKLTIGVQLVGDDGINTPPAHALSRRGLAAQLRGFLVSEPRDDAAPPILRAVADGEVDVATLWGPLAWYYAGRAGAPLRIEPIAGTDRADLPMQFDIAVGVRKGDDSLRAALDSVLARDSKPIGALLRAYHLEPSPREE